MQGINYWDVLPENEDLYTEKEIATINEALKLYFPDELHERVYEELIQAISRYLIVCSGKTAPIDFGELTEFLAPLATPFHIMDSLQTYEEPIAECLQPVLDKIAQAAHPGPAMVERTILVNGKEVHLVIDLDKGELAYREEFGTWDSVEI